MNWFNSLSNLVGLLYRCMYLNLIDFTIHDSCLFVFKLCVVIHLIFISYCCCYLKRKHRRCALYHSPPLKRTPPDQYHPRTQLCYHLVHYLQCTRVFWCTEDVHLHSRTGYATPKETAFLIWFLFCLPSSQKLEVN